MSKLVIKSNVDEAMGELNNKVPMILDALGLQAEGNAVSEITSLGAVDTGRLRASISHASDENSAYIGTNVEYAPYVELGTRKMAARPFLKNAVANYTGEYKQIVEDGLKR